MIRLHQTGSFFVNVVPIHCCGLEVPEEESARFQVCWPQRKDEEARILFSCESDKNQSNVSASVQVHIQRPNLIWAPKDVCCR